KGTFRLDLYYRLAGVSLGIPPLSRRPHRIVPLAEQLLRAAATQTGAATPRLSHEAAARLQAHRWPGNVRELRNVVERALVVSLGAGEIRAEHILIDATVPGPKENAAEKKEAAEQLREDEPEERQRIIDALAKCAGNQTRAAKLLGISRATLANRIVLYRI